MKEATGELNMTVVTVVAIVAVGAFFYAVVWPGIQTSLARSTCSNMCPGGKLDSTQGSGGVDTDQKICYCAEGDPIQYDDAADDSE